MCRKRTWRWNMSFAISSSGPCSATREGATGEFESRNTVGHVFNQPLDRLVEFCARDLGICTFVETGTFRGESAAWAAKRFRQVITIERNPDLHVKARDMAVDPNIVFRCGHSPDILPEIAASPNAKLYWLDAHWCGVYGDSDGIDDQCPIAGELTALRGGTADDIILIDDFHMFAMPPPEPFRVEQWPSLDELFSFA